LLRRLPREEGTVFYPYDDATSLRVRAPKGHISWGRGFNLEQCGSTRLFDLMERDLVMQCEEQIARYPWYQGGATRQSVLLDIAYNGGVHDLLGYPHMLAAYLEENWLEAAHQCTDKDPKLDASRYAPLRGLILTGDE
jgi:hypothetical protein